MVNVRWAAAVLLVCALAPFDRLGAYGLAINLAIGLLAVVAVYAAYVDDRRVR